MSTARVTQFAHATQQSLLFQSRKERSNAIPMIDDRLVLMLYSDCFVDSCTAGSTKASRSFERLIMTSALA